VNTGGPINNKINNALSASNRYTRLEKLYELYRVYKSNPDAKRRITREIRLIIGKLYGSNVGTSNAIRNIENATKLVRGKISSNVNKNLNRAMKTLKSGRRSSSYGYSSSRYYNNNRNRNIERLLGIVKPRAGVAAPAAVPVVAGGTQGPPVSISISNIGKVSNVGKASNVGKLSNSGKTSNAGGGYAGRGSNAGGGGYGSNAGRGSNAGGGGYGSNAGGSLGVSAPSSSGNRTLNTTPEQLIRGAGGNEAIEKGIKALKAANGNVTKAKAMSGLSNNTFTNIYALGGPVAAKKMVESRRRRRRIGAVGSKKKRVTQKPRKKYIKLTPYQFKRLTDHIKKNNLRRVLIKEITH
jgi:hypothetical protein